MFKHPPPTMGNVSKYTIKFHCTTRKVSVEIKNTSFWVQTRDKVFLHAIKAYGEVDV
jgi:hypothetical protein